MTPTKAAAATLRQLTDWRKGADVDPPTPHEVSEAIDAAIEMIERLEAAEKSDAEWVAMYRKARDERDAHKAAFEGWHQKTEWVQQGINDRSIPPTYLGWHRADVMTDMLKSSKKLIEELQDERDALRAALQHETDCLEAAKAKIDSLQATEEDSAHHKALAESALRVAKGWEDKCDELRAKIEQMEQQEPVAWYSKQYGFVYMSRHSSQFEHGSILYLRNGTPAWRIDGGSRVALLNMDSLPHGTVFYALPGAQEQEPTRD